MSNITVQQFEEEMVNLIQVLDQFRRLGIQTAESLIRQRGIAEARELARIRAKDGVDGAATLDQATALLVAGTKTAQIRADASASDFVARVKPEATSAIGRIVAKGGGPAAGYRLRVAADNGKLIADAVVDASGLFAIDMARAEFDRRAEETSQLHVTILDAKGAAVRQAQFPFVPGTSVQVWNFDLDAAPKDPRESRNPAGRSFDDREGLWPMG